MHLAVSIIFYGAFLYKSQVIASSDASYSLRWQLLLHMHPLKSDSMLNWLEPELQFWSKYQNYAWHFLCAYESVFQILSQTQTGLSPLIKQHSACCLLYSVTTALVEKYSLPCCRLLKMHRHHFNHFKCYYLYFHGCMCVCVHPYLSTSVCTIYIYLPVFKRLITVTDSKK